MTPNEINEAIAMSIGYRYEPRRYAGGWWIAPNNDASISASDYYYSLDACAEFERSLLRKDDGIIRTDADHYIDALGDIISANHGLVLAFDMVTATAAQRCEAYLKVRGLWK